jgi:small multidrug resistance family-3 protein
VSVCLPCRSTQNRRAGRSAHAAHLSCRGTPQMPGNPITQNYSDAMLQTILLFVLTAVAEILGCYLPWLVLKQGKPMWLLVPATASLALFAWLLTLHPSAAGRTYAAYGGVYIAVALAWLWLVDGITPSRWDLIGAGVALLGMTIIALQPQK